MLIRRFAVFLLTAAAACANDENHTGARLALNLKGSLPPGFEVGDAATLYPKFEDNSGWQAHSEAAVGRPLRGNWTFRAGMITDWDDFVPAGLRKHDNTYYVGLGSTY